MRLPARNEIPAPTAPERGHQQHDQANGPARRAGRRSPPARVGRCPGPRACPQTSPPRARRQPVDPAGISIALLKTAPARPPPRDHDVDPRAPRPQLMARGRRHATAGNGDLEVRGGTTAGFGSSASRDLSAELCEEPLSFVLPRELLGGPQGEGQGPPGHVTIASLEGSCSEVVLDHGAVRQLGGRFPEQR